MQLVVVGSILGLLFASTFFGMVFSAPHSESSSIVKDLPLLDIRDAELCDAGELSQSTANFSSNGCIQPVFDFYIVHVGDDAPLLGFTLQQKVARTQTAFNLAKTKWQEAWTANHLPPVSFTANYYAMVPSGTQVNIPGVNVIHIPAQYLTYNSGTACNNPHKICYVKDDISFYLAGDTSSLSQQHKLAFRERGTNDSSPVSGIGLFETTLKHNTNIPVVVVDNMKWYNSTRAGWSDTEHGVIWLTYLGFQNYDTGIFNQEQFSRTLAHEIGHLFGLGEDDQEPANLMAQTSQGGVGFSLGLNQAARAKAALCSPGLRPESIGKVQMIADNFSASCAGDNFLHSYPGLDEECTPGYSGSTNASQFLSATIKQRFCPIVSIQGTVLSTPLAVTDDPSSPHYYITVIQNNPGAQVKMCNVQTCRCEGIVGNPGATPTPRRSFVPQDTVPIPPNGNGGSYPQPTAPSEPTNCTSYSSTGPGSNSCPANAWCPPGNYCTSDWGSCKCVPNACGNGQLDAGEECDSSANGAPSCPLNGSCGVDCRCHEVVQP